MGDTEALPPGFRFHPTDEELVSYYLLKKVLDSSFTGRAITEVDLNRCEPWHLPEKSKIGEKEWYFFSLRDRKYPTGLRTNRATEAGYWKATGKDREIFSSRTRSLVGMKKTLVFYRGRAPKGEKSNWVMHEYRLEGKLSYHFLSKTIKDEWVVSRVFLKSNGGKKNFVSGFQRNSLYLGLLPPLTAASEAGTGSDVTSLDKPATEHVPCFSTINTVNSNLNPNLIPPLNYQPESMVPFSSLEEQSLQFPFLTAPEINEISGSGSLCFSLEPETVSGFGSSTLLRAMMEIGEGGNVVEAERGSVSIQRTIGAGFDGYNQSELESLCYPNRKFQPGVLID